VDENAGPAAITATLNASSVTTVSVDYASGDVTATAGADYTAVGDTLTFSPGQTSLTFTLTITDDGNQEPDETIRLTLDNPNNAILGVTNPATLTIADDGDLGGCAGYTSAGEPEIIPPDPGPDGVYAGVGCGSAIVADLGLTVIDTTTPDPAFDFVYYERGQTNPPASTTFIYMDWVVVQVGPGPGGPWYTVLYWGDGTDDTNSNVDAGALGLSENDNEVISTTLLYGTAPYTTGIAIDVDNPVIGPPPPPGIYGYVRFYVPPGGNNDVSEVDAIEVLP
jgi:hypothetical protein